MSVAVHFVGLRDQTNFWVINVDFLQWNQMNGVFLEKDEERHSPVLNEKSVSAKRFILPNAWVWSWIHFFWEREGKGLFVGETFADRNRPVARLNV